MSDRRRRVALVTGASSGLGNACATYLAKKGYTVYGTSRTPETVQRRADEFYELIKMDASDDDSVSYAVAYVMARERHIDALVCCAGVGVAGPVEETPIMQAARQMDVNFLGVARIVRETLPDMRLTGGAILVLGSIAGLIGVPFQAYYCASKFALEGFVESLRMELEGFPVRVTIIEPGDFRTGFTSARCLSGLADGSPYAEPGRAAIAAMESSERAGPDPVLVARLVYKLLDKKSLRPRYLVGLWFHKFGAVLKRILPYRLNELLLMAYYKGNV